jgi:thiamine biosynthesis lipoprotein
MTGAQVLGIVDGRALGGSIRIVVTDPSSLGAARTAIDDVIETIDAAASRFREDSELSRLNATPESEVIVSALLAQAIAAGLRGAALTDGAVDPTVGTAVRLAGYDSDFASVLKDGGPLLVHASRIPGWRAIRFDPARRSVWIPRGVEIDLGATAKALASDIAAKAAANAVRGGVLVSLGGDIAVAGKAPAGGWAVQVSEDSGAPIDAGEETVAIGDGGLATSSTTVRRWTRGGVVLHHIIDPATGLPVEGPWRTATVAAATCVDANVASTGAIVKGESAVGWLEEHGLAARLVDRDGRIHRTSRWPVPMGSQIAPKIF